MTKTNGRNTNGYVPARHILDELDKQKKEKKENPTYNTASLLNLKQGPISTKTADALVNSGKASATVKSGQIYVEPAKTAKTHETLFLPPAVETKRSETPASAAETSTKEQTKQKAGEKKNGFSAAKLAEGIINKGVTNAAHGVSSTLSLMESAAFAPVEALTGFDDLQERHGLFYNWNSAIEREREDAYRRSEENAAAGGKTAKAVDSVGTGAISALPLAITALMSGGTSLGAIGAKGLEATAIAAQQSPSALNALQSAVSGMANNPNFWTSFLRTTGESYEQAKAEGASDGKASLYAMSNGLMNAAVEVGGGLEALTPELRAGAPPLRQWLRASVQEGAEEPIQGVIERGLQNVVYGKKNPLFSVEDETAVFNPATAAKEFGVGAAVGGVLGGGQAAAGKAKNGLVPQARSAYSDSITGMEGTGNGGQGRNPGGTLRETAQAVTRGDYEAQAENGNRPKVQGGDGKFLEAFRDLWKRHGGLSVAQDSRQSLSQYNANVHIIPEAEWNRSDSAFTRNAEVYMRETIPEENRGMIAPHEGTHVMKQAGYQPYLDFIERTPEMIDLENDKAYKLLDEISAHRGIDPFDATESEIKTLYDELNATIYGHVASGKMPENMYNGLKSAFYDFDAYAAELAAIHQGYINSRYRASAQRPILPTLRNATRAFAGTPHDYAALLAELARERAEREALTPERERQLAVWNRRYPELRMTATEFLAR